MSSLIKPGDMVRMERTFAGVPYTHWGICVGDGDMVHFAPLESGPGSELAIKFNNNDPDAKIKVNRINMKFWAGGDAYCADNYLDKKHQPLPVNDIVSFALHQVKFCDWEYNLVLRNCEKFAIWCRYRVNDIGDQAKTGLTLAAVGAGIAFGLGIAAMAASGSSNESSSRRREKDKDYKEERYLTYK